MVLAGAGSGKTGVITHKIVHLIQERGIAEKYIFAVTFTNKAAREMKQRVKGLLKAATFDSRFSKRLNISTFHTFGLRMLQQECEHLNFRRSFTLMDMTDCLTALKELRSESNLHDDAPAILSSISRWKNDFVSPEEAIRGSQSESDHRAAKLYARYVKLLRAYNAMDFDDLITLPVTLLQDNDLLLKQWQNRTRHLLIDEYQDTNTAQYALIKLLVGNLGELTAVGDDDQSIYAWRGARPENIALLQRDFPRLKLIKLEQNYRSTSRILRCANHLIRHNPHVFEKALWSQLGVGDKLRLMPLKNEFDEADWVAGDILNRAFRQRIGYGEFAVLYRSNFQSRQFEQALRRRRINYQVSGGTSFFERAEIKDVLAYLRLVANPEDDTAFLRIVNAPRRGIGANTLEKLGLYARQRSISLLNACHEMGLSQALAHKPYQKLERFANWITLIADNAARGGNPLEVVNDLLEDIHYQDWLRDISNDLKTAEKRWQNVQEFVDWIGRIATDNDNNERSLADITAHISLMDILNRQDNDQPSNDTVNLMTLHAAKGLEFSNVYMVGLEEGILPHKNSIETDSIEEERRLCYVGITRAKKTLTLCYSKQRKKYGETIDCEVSRFLGEVPAEELHWLDGQPGDNNSQAQENASRACLNDLLSLLKKS